MNNSDYILEIKDICKQFKTTKALDSVSFNVKKGEMIGLIGASGSGKSTLLRLISGLITSDKESSCILKSGEVIQKNGKINSNIRKIRANIGFIFQQFNLVDRMSVLKNVLVGCLSRIPFWRGWLQIFSKRDKLFAMEALNRVDMETYALQKAGTLSGGQQQRAAIARTLVQKSEVILADEPIASLDPESAKKVMKILSKINKEDNTTVLVTLHQVDYALKYCRRIIALNKGKIVLDCSPEEITNEMLYEIYGSKIEEACIDDDFNDFKKKWSDEKVKEENKFAEIKAYL